MRNTASAILFSIVFAAGMSVESKAFEDPAITDPDYTIRVRTDLFEIPAVVTDGKGRPVKNLTIEDFELLQDGVLQQINSLSIIQVDDLLTRESETEEHPPDEASSAGTIRTQLREPPKRTAIFYVATDSCVTGKAFEIQRWVKKELHRFIDKYLSPGDLVAITDSEGSTLGITQQFTRDRQLLRYAVDLIGYGCQGYTPDSTLLNDLDTELNDLNADRNRDGDLDNLKRLVLQIADMPGQRMIVFISSGLSLREPAPLKMKGSKGYTGIKFPQYKKIDEVINLATRHGVAIYTIDGLGLETGVTAETGNSISIYNSGYDDRNEKLEGLVMLARDTGGELYRFTNSFSQVISQAFDNNRYYYLLSYYPKLDAEADTIHKLDVRVRNHPEYRVRTAQGFSSVDLLRDLNDTFEAEPQRRLVRQMQSAAAKFDIGVSAWFDFMQNDTDDRQTTLTVSIDADSFTYRQATLDNSFDIEIVYLIYDHRGNQVAGNSVNVEGSLTQRRLEQALENGFRLTRHFYLKPGLYQARVGVREKDTGLVGTTSTWIQIPDLKRQRLVLSSFALSGGSPVRSDIDFQISSDDQKKIMIFYGVPLLPRDQVFNYSFHVYRNDDAFNNTELTIKTELFRGGEMVMEIPWRPLAFDPDASLRIKRLEVEENLDFSGFDPGIYDLRVSVRDQQLKRTVARTMTIGLE
jgi:VWFA-related protein